MDARTAATIGETRLDFARRPQPDALNARVVCDVTLLGSRTANDRDHRAERPLLDELLPPFNLQRNADGRSSSIDRSCHFRLDLAPLLGEVAQHHIFYLKPLHFDFHRHSESVGRERAVT
jgi:hypothetical protein